MGYDAMTRPSAKQIAREFKSGATMFQLYMKYELTYMQIEDAIRKYVKPGGRAR